MGLRDSLRSRPIPDIAMLAAVTVIVVIALTRFAFVAAAIPVAVFADRTAPSGPAGSVEATGSDPVLQRIAHSAAFASWWGGRRIPYRAGGSNLAVIANTQRATARALGCLIGIFTARDLSRGIRVVRVIVPADRERLLGEPPGVAMTLASGEVMRTGWGPMSADSALYSDVPVIERPYDPVLTESQASAVVGTASLTERTKDFFTGAQPADASGTWILVVRVAERRQFLLIPVESSPIGGAL